MIIKENETKEYNLSSPIDKLFFRFDWTHLLIVDVIFSPERLIIIIDMKNFPIEIGIGDSNPPLTIEFNLIEVQNLLLRWATFAIFLFRFLFNSYKRKRELSKKEKRTTFLLL